VPERFAGDRLRAIALVEEKTVKELPEVLSLDWDLEDPAGQDLDAVRRIRDDIDDRVRALVAELVPAG
jgi:arsenate reductase